MIKMAAAALSQILLLAGMAGAQVFTGIVTDSMCGIDHGMMQRSPDAICVTECVRQDKAAKFVLFDGRNSYRLSDQETPARFAGQRVKITGRLYEKTGIIKVDLIEAVK